MAPDDPPSTSGDTVVLVHGLWMRGLVMLPLQWLLKRHGFTVRRFSYPSRRHGIQQNAAALARFADTLPGARVHVVGHSLGGVLALVALSLRSDGRDGRTVLMGAPCNGSYCAAFLLRWPLLRTVVGQSLGDWLALAAPARLPITAQIGVLAGTRSCGLGRLVPGLPQPNDGVVTLMETNLPAAHDSIRLAVSHSQMLFSAACAAQAAAFIRTGRFSHD